jgi:predicted GNAT family acetyltransferase
MPDAAADVRDAPERERWEISVDGALAGFAAYHRRRDLIAFVHTEIDPAYEGRGLGSQLIAGALEGAREAGLHVLPFCPFVRGYIERHPEQLDLVPETYRAQFDL